MPLSSSLGLPLGKESSITRYSHSSEFTNGAIHVFFPVTTTSVSSKPRDESIFATPPSGLGVILSIIDQGKDTFSGLERYSLKPSSTNPSFCQASATSITPFWSFSPLWEQLSMETKANGKAPALNLSRARAVTIQITVEQFSGPFGISS